MKTNKTEIVFILDKSGSMSGLETDTIGGFNAMLKKQQAVEGEAVVTTVLFDNEYYMLHDRFDIKGIKPMTDKEYFVGGTTALLDAMGRTINKIINIQKNQSEQAKADQVLFVIITDGLENASREYRPEKIRKMVKDQREKYGWEFIFLGANIDAITIAEEYGISNERVANYHADSGGIEINFASVGKAIAEMRATNKISNQWKKNIEKDYKSRKK